MVAATARTSNPAAQPSRSRTPAMPLSTNAGLPGLRSVLHLVPGHQHEREPAAREEPVVGWAAVRAEHPLPHLGHRVDDPRQVEDGIAHLQVAPVDHAGQVAGVGDQHVLRTDVAVGQAGREPEVVVVVQERRQRPLRRRALAGVEQREHVRAQGVHLAPESVAHGRRRRRAHADELRRRQVQVVQEPAEPLRPDAVDVRGHRPAVDARVAHADRIGRRVLRATGSPTTPRAPAPAARRSAVVRRSAAPGDRGNWNTHSPFTT